MKSASLLAWPLRTREHQGGLGCSSPGPLFTWLPRRLALQHQLALTRLAASILGAFRRILRAFVTLLLLNTRDVQCSAGRFA